METKIPFAGFYNTWYSEEIDREQEQYAESLQEEYPDVSLQDINDVIFNAANYGEAYKHAAREYVPAYVNWLKQEHDVDIKLTFNTMQSPKEYNFRTDEIFCDISLDDVKKLAKKAGWTRIQESARKLFTSRDGFCSFYSPRPAEWGKLAEWDHNQLYAILCALETEDTSYQCFVSMSDAGDFCTAFNCAINDSDIRAELEEKQTEAEELEAIENPNGFNFPVTFKNTADYIKQFEQLNGLKS